MQNNEILTDLNYLIDSGIHEFLDVKPRIYYSQVSENKKMKHTGDKDSFSLNLNDINSLQELRKAIDNFQQCKLKNTAKKTVFADGNPKSKIMLIGEAPGAEEDIQGLPFVGKAGQLLNKMLAAINLDRKNVYITNIIPWRPPGNRQPTIEEILLCLPFIQKHIELINPKILVLLGGTATKALLMSNEGIMRLQGKWYEYSSYGLVNPISTRVVFHPAFLLRSPRYKKQTWEDLKEIKKKLDS